MDTSKHTEAREEFLITTLRRLTTEQADLLWSELIELAEAEVTAAEQRRVQSCADNRIAMAECDRWMTA